MTAYSAKSIVIDIADNWGDSSFLGIRAIDFWYLGSKIALTSSDFTAYSTTCYGAIFDTANAFDTTLSKTGSQVDTSWAGTLGSTTNQRLICVLDTQQPIDEIRVNNWHQAGSVPTRGSKIAKIYISTDTITDTTYNASISNSTLIFDDQFDEHVSSDTEDEQILELLGTMNIIAGVPYLGNPGTSIQIPDDIVVGTPYLGNPVGISFGEAVDIVAGTPILGSPAGDFVFTDLSTANLMYSCTLTGTTDVVLPISSFQCRARSGEQTYLSVVVPGLDYADDISSRSDGQIIVYAQYVVGGVVRLTKELARVNLSDITIHDGTQNKSIVLIGYRQETFTSKAVTMTGYTYYNLNDGEYRYRFATPDFTLNPGDEVTIDSISFTVDVISFYVDVFGTTMEVSG